MPPLAAPVTGAAIAADAMRYVGRGYVFGGNASAPGDWDCSSFVSYVLGHDLNMPLPGGRWGQPGFPPSSHGPVVETYASWSGAVPISVGQAGAGDLVLFVGIGAGGHMGIVLGPNKMISALNSQQGTLVSPILGYGPVGVPPVYRHLTGVPGGVPSGAPGPGTSGVSLTQELPGILSSLMRGVVVVAGLVAVVVGAAALAGWGLYALSARAMEG